MILDIQKLFNYQGYLGAERIVSETIMCGRYSDIRNNVQLQCDRVKYSKKHVLILYENLCKIGDAGRPDLPKGFWELILYSQFVPMSDGSFFMKVVMIG